MEVKWFENDFGGEGWTAKWDLYLQLLENCRFEHFIPALKNSSHQFIDYRELFDFQGRRVSCEIDLLIKPSPLEISHRVISELV